MNYTEAIQYLYQLRRFGTKLGLEKPRQLAARFGNPQENLRFVHVAGTNGKGSTCSMIESIYRTSGLRVGLFTSPHLVAFTERIQIDRKPIPEADVARLAGELQSAVEEFPPEATPTFFEVVTVMALRYFAEQNCGLVVWETGLGGRLDATNIVTPIASVITNIHYDHERWLGRKLSEIAIEKAGIIKPGILVVTGEEKPEVLAILARAAQDQGAPLVRVSRDETKRPPLSRVQMPLLGDHQRINAAVAVATVRALSDRIPVDEDAITSGLQRVQWPGRLQILRTGVGRTVVLDGAHNPAGVEALNAALQKHFPGTLPTFIFGALADKNWTVMGQLLAPMAGRILLTPIESQPSADPQSLRELCQGVNLYAEVLACRSVSEALQRAAYDPLVVVTGSLYLVGEAMVALKLANPSSLDERGLNDWSAAPKP